MRMVPSPVWPLAGQSIFGQNTVCGSMTSSFPVLSTRNCHLIRTLFQVLAVRSPFSLHLPSVLERTLRLEIRDKNSQVPTPEMKSILFSSPRMVLTVRNSWRSRGDDGDSVLVRSAIVRDQYTNESNRPIRPSVPVAPMQRKGAVSALAAALEAPGCDSAVVGRGQMV